MSDGAVENADPLHGQGAGRADGGGGDVAIEIYAEQAFAFMVFVGERSRGLHGEGQAFDVELHGDMERAPGGLHGLPGGDDLVFGGFQRVRGRFLGKRGRGERDDGYTREQAFWAHGLFLGV